MGALAGLLKQRGHDVRGSDNPLYPPMSTQLATAGIPVFVGYRAENLDWQPDCVVVGNVCSKDHVEVLAAQERGLPLESFPGLLRSALLEGKRSLVVAGTHGKTTTTALLSWLLRSSGRDPSYLVGGVPLNLGRSAQLGEGPAFVIEGDEYDTAFFDKESKFLHYQPQRAILTSVEFDHADIFEDFEAVKRAFEKFVALIPEDGELLVHAADPRARAVAKAAARCAVLEYRVISEYAPLEPSGQVAYEARIHKSKEPGAARRTVFEVFEHGQSLGLFTTLLVGEYNVCNILAAIAVARLEGCDADALRRAIRRFRGVRRRQELVGVAQGVRVITDFAHHPTAVRLTLKALRKRYPQAGLHVCFEPRSASSRRQVFFQDYAGSFGAATRVHIGPLYRPDKIAEEQRMDPGQLARAITSRGVAATAYPTVEALSEAVRGQAASGDTVVVLSCGSFDGLVERLLRKLGDAVRFATDDDMAEVDALCRRCGLAAVEDRECTDTLIIRGEDESVVGCVSLQTFEDDSLLFSLVVAPERRGEGLGWVLAGSVVRWARTLGAERVFLLTEEAADFFANHLGFRPIPMASVPATVRVSTNFRRALTREDTTSMVLELGGADGV